MKPRILITGASGFLGGVLVKAMRDAYEIVFTYSSNPIKFDNAQGHPLNLCDEQSVLNCVASLSPDAVVHCAAIAHAGICQREPERARQVNVEGTENIVHAALEANALLFHISTDLVFDGENAPYVDDAERNPVSVYGEAKRDAEDIVLQQGGRAVVVRPALIYGPVSDSGKGSFLQWMKGKLAAKEPLPVFHDEYRTPVYAPDLARVITTLLEANGGTHRVYNAGGSQQVNRVQFAQAICDVWGYDASYITPVAQADIDTGYPRVRDVSLVNQHLLELGFTPTPIRDALAEIAAQ